MRASFLLMVMQSPSEEMRASLLLMVMQSPSEEMTLLSLPSVEWGPYHVERLRHFSPRPLSRAM
jgi:hypothetical protein